MCVHVSEPEVFYGSESRATHFTRTCPWRIPKTRAKPRVCWSLIRLPRCGSSWSFWCIWLSSWLGWQGRADSAAWSPNLYWSGIRLLILNRGRKRAPNLRVADHPEPRKTGIEREDGLGDQDDRTQHRAGLIHRRRQPRRDYEMAGYLTAVRLAERLGAREGVALLQKSRSEEQAAEQTLRKIATGLRAHIARFVHIGILDRASNAASSVQTRERLTIRALLPGIASALPVVARGAGQK
jgi:hypothetical protein